MEQLVNGGTAQKVFNEPSKVNLILRLTTEFSLEIIEYVEKLETEKKFVVARQLLTAATSVGVNSREAQNAESDRDFIHRFTTALREADETAHWLELCQKAPSYPPVPESMIAKLESIVRIVNRIITTTKKKTTAPRG